MPTWCPSCAIKCHLDVLRDVSPAPTKSRSCPHDTSNFDAASSFGAVERYFGDRALGSIRPEDVAAYRAQRVQYKRISCRPCAEILTRRVCKQCGSKREDAGVPVSTQTVNHDHMTLVHMFNVARSPQFRLVSENPAAHVPKPNPQYERTELLHQRSGNGLEILWHLISEDC